MAIYDCFQFFDEEHILDLRLNILNEFVDYFVIAESTVDHQGNPKKLNLDLKKFNKFNKKIIYIVVDDTPDSIKKSNIGEESLVEQHQRNALTRGLKNCRDDDLILLSDADEVPNLRKLNMFDKKKKYAVFSQKMFNYKINLLNETENKWKGSRICLKKDLNSPQWLRNLKFKQYPFWRIDKPGNFQIIENGGWHFAYLQSPENISKKIKSFSHGEFNKEDFVNLKNIKEKILMEKDIFDREISYKKVPIDNSFPKYIVDNQEKLKEWII